MKRPGTRSEQFVQRIPADVKAKVRGMKLALPLGSETVNMTVSKTLPDIRLSLRTADPVEAKARHNAISAYLAGIWQSVRHGPKSMTFESTVALAGEWYREMVAEWSAEPGRATEWENLSELIIDAQLGLERDETRANWQRLEFLIQPDRFLQAKAVMLSEADRQRFLREAGKALTQAAGVLERRSSGDYRPDPDAARFPLWSPEKAPPAPAKNAVKGATLLELLTKLAAERAYAPKTVSEWTRSLISLADSAGTSVAADITPDHVIAWTDALVAKGLSAKTINETYIAAAKALFRWAKSKRYLSDNPTSEAPKVSRRGDDEEGKRGFTLAEAKVVLSAALVETAPARRWATWLLAHTGARAGEIMQLRRQDVRQEPESGVWYIDISPAAGRLKNKPSARVVPLHSQLLDLGFLNWVKAQPNDRLFYEEREGEAQDGRRPRKSVAVNRLGDWVRDLGLPGVLSGEVSPNHGWRHRFITELSNREVTDTVRKRITGHALEGQDNRYVGQIVMERLSAAVERLPAYDFGSSIKDS